MTTISKTMYTLTTSQFAFIKAIRPFAKSTKQFTVPHSVNFPFTLLNTWAKKAGYSICPMWIMTADRKVSRGIYSLPEFCADDSVISVTETKRGRKSGSKNHNTPKTKTVQVASATEKVSTFSAVLSSVSSSAATELSSDMTTAEMVLGMTNGESDSFVPAEDPNYVSWGYHTEIKKIIKSGAFCPVFITGLSGNGKTTMVEQACAQLGRECIRVNLTAQTDEDELIGGFRLQNGQTVFCPGPALVAMTRGAVLLLDEVDLGTHLIMCLQSILEGKGKFIPKIGKFVRPAKGFTIMATANTKGKGSEDGRFIGTNQMNEAFLERFRFTYEQDYASTTVEKKIISKYAESVGVSDDLFVTNLVNWADIIRKSFKQQVVNDIITTRRLRDIVFAFSIFGDKMTAIERCVARFDDETKRAFVEFYTKVDAEVQLKTAESVADTVATV
jgi:MoxR-like ATPase